VAEDFALYIGGEFRAAEGGATFDSLDPSTGKVWAKMPRASASDTNAAVAAARAAFLMGPWPKMTAGARGKLLGKLADLLARDAGVIAELETRDTGKVIRETRAVTGYVAEFYRYFAGLADKIEGATLAIDKPDLDVSTRREPLGVVAAVVPWNSQMFLTATKAGPALAAGNTLVIKASEDGPAPLLHFARLVHEAGFPPGAVNVITGFGPECGQVLTSHPHVARVAFTGGAVTARAVVRNTAENFAVTTLELGGKSPVLVFEDCDFQSAVNGVVAGIWGATGQSCVAGSRLFLQRNIHDRFIEELKARAARIKIGAPLDPATEMGPLCTERQRKRAEELIAASLARGAKVATGGKSPNGDGFYFEPTVLLAGDQNLPCMREEFFAPVLSVAPFDTEAEAVQFANNSDHAFAAGVFTRDLARAHRLARDIRAGVVWVNTYRAVSPVAPFGGNGFTGYGREGGLDAIRDYTRTKTVWFNLSDQPMADPFVMR
jgi:acyl-CoA reductase-like NAD-dependent aldehyde dehydrogenase